MHNGRFSKWSYFLNIKCFLKRVFAENNSKSLVKLIMTCILEFQFLTQSDDFAKAIGFP